MRRRETYVLEGVNIQHEIRERTDTFVKSMCGATANVERLRKLDSNEPIVRCFDCRLISEAEDRASRNSRYRPPLVTELE